VTGGGTRSWVEDAMAVVVYPSPEALAAAAADQAAAALTMAVAARGVAHAMFATGNSQLTFIDLLVGAGYAIPWRDIVVFHMDEYVGVDGAHPAGFQRWIRHRIVDRVHPRAAHYLDGTNDPDAEAERYAALLAAHPLDLCCLGIGENGHLAFNDPPVARFDDPVDVKVVELDEACRLQQVNEGHFPDLGAVPARAVTVTIPALLHATTVLAIVPEERKAQPVAAALNGPISPACPASVLRRHDNVTLHLDAGSASLLAR
jgi:glucosamine-6-phosphate deaminase